MMIIMVFDPVRFRKKLSSVFLLFIVASFALFLRIYMLRTVETRLDADESIVGIMGKHISEGENIPFFFYGQHYGGGHVIEALTAAAWRKINPAPSPAAVQAAPILFSVLILFLVFSYTKTKIGMKQAFLAVLLLSVSTPFLKSSLKADGYIETIFLGLLSLNLLAWAENAAASGRIARSALLYSASGFILSIAVWSYDFALIYVAVVFASAIPRAVRNPIRLLLMLAGSTVGAIPLISYNISHNFAHLRHLTSGGPAGFPSISEILLNFSNLFTKFLPAFFTPDCVHNFVTPPLYSWATFSAVIISLLCLIPLYRKIPAAVPAIPLLVFVLFSVSGYSGRSPRYLLPAEPFLSIAISSSVCFLYSSRHLFLRFFSSLILFLFAIGTFSGNSYLFKDDSVVEGNVKTNPHSLPHIVDLLKENNVDCIFTTYFIKWQILFLSDEKIQAVDTQAAYRDTSFPAFDSSGCPPDALPTFVLHESSPYRTSLPSILKSYVSSYKVFFTMDHIVFIPSPE